MALTPQQIWETSLGQIQLLVPRPSYDTWFRGTRGLSLEGDLLTVGVPTPFASEWLERRMYQLIQRIVTEVTARGLQVRFQVTSSDGPIPAANQSGALEATLPERSPSNGIAAPSAASDPWEKAPVNRRYTFETFVVGKDNQLAHAAAAAVAERPGAQYNPLFIYSGVGLGKTHLLHAIASSMVQRNMAPVYVTAERFTNEFILAIRERRTEEFRAKYRTADVLLMDDIQFLAGKEQTQESFFHTFNDLHNSNRQIVVACDKPPGAVALLEDRLRSRFEWGLVTDIQPPKQETRFAILHTKAAGLGIQLSDAVAQAIALRGTQSIRELEGHLNRVAAMAHFLGVAITLEVVDIALGAAVPPPLAPSTSYPLVIQCVAAAYNISPEVLCTRAHDRRTTHPQQLAMYILSRHLRLPTSEIASQIGHWHPKTVNNALKHISHKLAIEATTQQELQHLLQQLSIPAD